eukprot:scaffold5246_cov105-Isochrysis_galbana.AAC.2
MGDEGMSGRSNCGNARVSGEPRRLTHTGMAMWATSPPSAAGVVGEWGGTGGRDGEAGCTGAACCSLGVAGSSTGRKGSALSAACGRCVSAAGATGTCTRLLGVAATIANGDGATMLAGAGMLSAVLWAWTGSAEGLWVEGADVCEGMLPAAAAAERCESCGDESSPGAQTGSSSGAASSEGTANAPSGDAAVIEASGAAAFSECESCDDWASCGPRSGSPSGAAPSEGSCGDDASAGAHSGVSGGAAPNGGNGSSVQSTRESSSAWRRAGVDSDVAGLCHGSGTSDSGGNPAVTAASRLESAPVATVPGPGTSPVAAPPVPCRGAPGSTRAWPHKQYPPLRAWPRKHSHPLRAWPRKHSHPLRAWPHKHPRPVRRNRLRCSRGLHKPSPSRAHGAVERGPPRLPASRPPALAIQQACRAGLLRSGMRPNPAAVAARVACCLGDAGSRRAVCTRPAVAVARRARAVADGQAHLPHSPPKGVAEPRRHQEGLAASTRPSYPARHPSHPAGHPWHPARPRRLLARRRRGPARLLAAMRSSRWRPAACAAARRAVSGRGDSWTLPLRRTPR